MATYDLTTASNLFKTKYVKLTDNFYNSANVLAARIKKRYDFVGKQEFYSIPLSFGGGVGSGSLPLGGVATYEDALVTSKKVYAIANIDREAIKAASTDEGAFVRMTKEPVKKALESYMRNWSRIWFNDGTGALGTGDNATNVAGTGVAGDPYTFTISAATWKEANWEEDDYVNIGTETTPLQVTVVAPATRLISVVGTSAILAALTGVGPLNSTVYMQNSRNNDPYGLKVLEQAVGTTLYGVTLTRKFSAGVQGAAGGAGLTTDVMNEDILAIEKKSGKVIDLIVMSYTQMRKLLNLLEDHKQYNVDPRQSDLIGKVSFKGIEFMSSKGAIPVFADRFVEDSRIYYLNSDYLETAHRPGTPGWVDEDGNVFSRLANDDSFESRYASYCQNLIWLPFHGYRSGLAT